MTPLDPFLDGVWLKREDEHQLGSFKWRGAQAVLAAYRPDLVVTASTGNHGAATAWAARRAGVRAVVFVPEGASATKTGLIEQQRAELRRAGADLDEAKAAARAFAAEAGGLFFEDGAEPAQFEGYEAIGEEIIQQVTGTGPRLTDETAPSTNDGGLSTCRVGIAHPPACVVVPVGNGALAIGVFRALARRAPETERVAVSAAAAPAMWESWRAGRPVDSDRCDTFADGLAVREAIPLAVAELNPLVQRFDTVSERELALALRRYAEAGIRVEGAAAAPLACLSKGGLPRPAVLLVTGRNIDEALYSRILTGD